MLGNFFARFLIVPAALALTAFASTGHAQQAPAGGPKAGWEVTVADRCDGPMANASLDFWVHYRTYRSYARAYRAAYYLNSCGYFTQIVLSNCGCYYHVYYYCQY
jgi:hypothetical protein